MGKTVLVSIDLDKGAEIVSALDDANLKISVALWLYSNDHEDWRLALSSRRLDEAEPSAAYGLLHDALEARGITLEQTPTFMILPMTDPFVRALRRMFGKARSAEGMRLGGQMVGDRFIEGAYVYRIR